ncbi:hypothetical protein F511_17917 [Dorcoceras hygrometricum]|uniref:Dystroglycan-like n=1 Tax=Dorcoceras hygrometricum TaxID=472368 RepID=A0A2Z7BSJ2_9LAMI|nr:hypothetical protein F511_17917 [Dorcoceras hygrometricum]
MASSYISNALQINFESVLEITDNAEMVSMFKTLESTGLRGFLGCSSVLYERELEQFFDTAMVKDGDITCEVSGKVLTTSEDRFAGVFGLPTEGLVNLSEVPKDLVYDARSIFSQSGEPISTYGKKRLMKYELRLLNDVLAKSITVKAGSFDVVTHERFLMMTAIHFGIQVNWSKILFGVLKEMVDKTLKKAKGFAAKICVLLKGDSVVTMGEATTFPPLKILSAKTVKTYIATNETIDARGKIDEPGVAKIARSKKRPIATGDESAVTKKKRTSKRKSSSSKDNMDIVSVAQEAIPLQTFESSTAVSVEKRAAVEEAIGEQSVEPTTDTIEKETVSTADEFDNVIAQEFAARQADRIVESASEKPTTDTIEKETVSTADEFDNVIAQETGTRPVFPRFLLQIKGRHPFWKEIRLKESFSFKKLANLKIEDIYAKEELVLSWDEADSTRVALHGKMHILTKYRELLIRKFLEARKSNFVPSEGSSATDLKVLDWLSDLHLFVLEELKEQMLAHGLTWEKTTKTMVNGSLLIQEGNDQWMKIPRLAVSCRLEILRQLSYVDTLPPVSEFFKMIRKRWADVCIEAVEFFVSGKLLPLGSLNFCRSNTAGSEFGYRRTTVTSWGWSQLCIDFLCYSLFGGFSTVDIRNFVSAIALDRSVFRETTNFDSVRPDSPSTSAISSMRFDEDDTAATQFSLPVISTDLTEALAQLRASVEQIHFEKIRRKDDVDKLRDILLMHIRDLEKKFSEIFDAQDRAYRALLNNIRKDIHDQKTLLSRDVLTSQQKLSTQVTVVAFDNADIRKEVKEKRAILTDLDGQVATVRSELLDFRAKAKENHLNLSTQLGFLVDYINRGGDAKKGEGGSSSRTQPPPNDQSRPSGGNGSRADDQSRLC